LCLQSGALAQRNIIPLVDVVPGSMMPYCIRQQVWQAYAEMINSRRHFILLLYEHIGRPVSATAHLKLLDEKEIDTNTRF
jgi:hypothetical protein